MSSSITDINEVAIQKYVESIRPDDPEIRKKVDMGYSYDGKVCILYEIRPVWNDPSTIQHIEYAKIRYYKSRKEWHLYWMRASGKWELYEPYPKSSQLNKLLQIIKEDKYACFYG